MNNSTFPSTETCITDTILMIEPVAFGYNPQTAVNNYFQNESDLPDSEIQRKALAEFQAMVKALKDNEINVITLKDNPYPHTPDAVFPNNWISFHLNNHVILYPMFAENRRLERRMDVLLEVENQLNRKFHYTDYSQYENENVFLEGTGSVVPDRKNRIAYASISPRTDKALFLKFCEAQNFRPVYFHGTQTVDNEQLPIYHTNVMMCLADNYVVICLDTLEDEKERKMIEDELRNSGKELIEITEKQMHSFAGNMLQLKNRAGEKLLIMSQSAYNSLEASQIQRLEHFNRIVAVAVPTIEQNGGGSVRCMITEVF